MKNSSLNDGEIYADDLTWREQEILILLAERLMNREIAGYLHLAENTVKAYIENILSSIRERITYDRFLHVLLG